MLKPVHFLLCSIVAVLAPGLRADPVAEITSFSVFKEVNLAKLAKGEVIAAGIPPMRFSRGLGVESLFVLPMPVAKANELQQAWNGLRHSELKLYQYGDLPRQPSAKDFQRMASAPQNSAVRSFVSATEKLDPARPELQMSVAEAKAAGNWGAGAKGTMPPGVSEFWSNLLAGRARAFSQGGLPAQPAYVGRSGPVRAADDVAELLRERAAVKKQFSALLGTMTGGGGGSAASHYEMFDVEGRAALSLGATYSRSAGDSIQSGVLQYYSSDGYYVMLTLSQMWPVQIDGKPATLVWRGDLLSSSQLGELRGIERSGASVAMRKEIQKNVSTMVKDLSSAR